MKMIKSNQIFKAGLCTIFGAVAFSLFFWNGYMTDTGRYMIWKAFEGDSHLLMFAIFMMPLLMGLPTGFALIFYSFRRERIEREDEINERIAIRDQKLENPDLTPTERLDIILNTHKK